jgi:hypothetical protein
MYPTFMYLVANATFWLREVNILILLPKLLKGFHLVMIQIQKLIVFNKSSRLAEFTSDVVFDETNGSPREQVDPDEVDGNEIPMMY